MGFQYDRHGYLTKELDSASNKVYRHVTAMDARNLITQSHLANNKLFETVDYAHQTGQMRGIKVKKGGDLRHSLDYLYDGFGNLHFRETKHGDDRAEERFEYDLLHRVTKSTRRYNPAIQIGNTPDEVINYAFDKVGNLTLKSDYAEGYSYTGKGTIGKPNAVKQVQLIDKSLVGFGYDNNGNMTIGHNKAMAYNVFNKPTRITSGNSTSDFQYGADTMRYKKEETGTNTKTTIYIDKLMEIVSEGNTVKHKAYIGGTAVVTDTQINGATNRQTHYLLKGRLGSTITVTDDNGDVIEANGFDPFGKPRTGLWQDKANNQLQSQVTTRGYTGHEHLDESQLIHMNGRAYDYNLGRFLSVDPYIQEPGNSQSMNPYSYIMNNPLAGVDPTGYTSEEEVTRDFKVSEPGSRIKRTVTATADGNGGVSLSGGNISARAAVKSQLNSVGLTVNGSSNSQGTSTMGANAGGGNNSVSGIGGQGQSSSSDDDSSFWSFFTFDVSDFDLGLGSAMKRLSRSIEKDFMNPNKAGDIDSTVSRDLAGVAMSGMAESMVNGAIDVGVNYAITVAPVGEALAASRLAVAAKGAARLCFVEGTPVHTKDGVKPIEEIEIGDLVASKNDKTGKVEWKPVVELFRNNDKEVLNIGFAGSFGKLETLGVTAEHPFWVEGKGWTNAGDLAIDDEITTLDNGVVKVASIASDAKKHTTYNFEVEDFHTYFVGESALWVHNMCADDVIAGLARSQPNLFRNFNCDSCAQGIANALKNEGISGSIVRLQVRNPSSTGNLVLFGDKVIGKSGFHEFVVTGGRFLII